MLRCRSCDSPLSGRQRKWCSDACRLRVYNQRPETKTRHAARQADNYFPRRPVSFPTCHWCGEIFTCRTRREIERPTCYEPDCQRAKNNDRQRRFTAQWKDDHGENYRRAQHPDSYRAGRMRRKAREAEAFIEDVDPDLIYERDDYRCQLCGHEIDMTASFPDQWSPTLDHIIPLARGGLHEPDNVQAAHLTCNAAKGARVAA